MSIFNPLRIEVDMTTSVIHTNSNPIHLDGLLYCSIYNKLKDHEKVMKELDTALSKSQGVYHASQALFEKKSKIKINKIQAVHLTMSGVAELNGILSKSRKIVKKNEGLLCEKSVQMLGIQVKKIVFFAHGDAKKISFYLNSLTGKELNVGFGEIEKISVNRIVEDCSWFLDYKLNRILPISIFYNSRTEPVRSCRYVPNYKSSNAVECYIPISNTLIV